MTVIEGIATIVALGSVAALTVSNMDDVQKDATVQLQAHNCRMLAYYERMEKVSNINIDEYRQEVLKHGDCGQ